MKKMKISKKSSKPKNIYEEILQKFDGVTSEPEIYLSAQPKKAKGIKDLLQNIYTLGITHDADNKDSNILPELVLQDMDEEQIWQQLDIRNKSVWTRLLEGTSKMLSLNDERFVISFKDSDDEKESENMDEGEEEEDYFKNGEDFGSGSDFTEDEEDDIEDNKKSSFHTEKRNYKPSIVDDKFFKLGEMEAFLKGEDEKELLKQKGKLVEDDDAIDYFNDDLSDEDEENVNYKDFFDQDDDEMNNATQNGHKKRKHSETFDEEDEYDDDEADDNQANEEEMEEDIEDDDRDDDNSQRQPDDDQLTESSQDEGDNNDENHNKSSYELRQERLKQRIEEYEEQRLGEKPWQLKGELLATDRPQNSLLEEVLEFDSTQRPAPIITEETTLRLEDIIKQRIKDQAWDDVERKVKPTQTPQEFRKKLILDSEKSKESLAQVYEKQYQNELEKLNPNSEQIEEEPKAHKEIKSMMRTLFIKLDALSNFHFTPKPVAPEPKIITNTPALNMEEVAPVSVSDAKLLAPEEVRTHSKGVEIGKSERSKADKNRERRKKKLFQKNKYKAQEERVLAKQKLGIKPSEKDEKNQMLRKVIKNRNVDKVKVTADSGAVKSSKAFFTQLQDKTTMKPVKAAKKSPKDGFTAKKLKL